MKQIKCHLISHSTGKHLSQVLTGFSLLHRLGLIKLSQECQNVSCIDSNKEQHLRDASLTHLQVLLDNKIRLFYDMHDSSEVDSSVVENVDFYFKRSFAPALIPSQFLRKVFPFGLNYAVYADYYDPFELQRMFLLKNDPSGKRIEALQFLMRVFGRLVGHRYFVPTNKNMRALPDLDKEPRVLFMARAWDPLEGGGGIKAKIEQRERINHDRMRCIELLRKEFGDAFFGGFERTDYALKNFKHVVLKDKKSASKGNYIELLRSFPVCVATTGLHGSIGWKMGEYVAFSKAIVSEKINYCLPGHFESEKNYLEFIAPEQCVDQVSRLFSDKELRDRLMKNNQAYYMANLKPDVLILNTLMVALAQSNGGSS